MDSSIGAAENKVGATIAEQVSALSPQPRDDGGRFAGKTPPAPETRSRYDHPVLTEDAIHQQLLGLVQGDGTPEQWQPDVVKAELPKEPEAPAQEAAPQEEVKEEPAGESFEIDYEAPLFETKVKVEGGGEEVKKREIQGI